MKSLGLRLALAFGALLALLLGVGGYGLVEVHSLAALEARQAALSDQRQLVSNWSALTRLNVARTLALACVQLRSQRPFRTTGELVELCEKNLSGEVIQQRDVKGGSATFDITVDGGSDTIAAAVEGKKAGKYTVEVVEGARGKVILKLN